MTDITTSSPTYTSAMLFAYSLAAQSPDPSTQLGAVLLDEDGFKIGAGFNHFPEGIDEKHWHGPKEGKYERVAHAEVSAILDAAKRGESTLNSTLVCPWASCANCAKYMVEAGVKRLVRHVEHDPQERWMASIELGDEIMSEGGIEIIEIEPVPTSILLIRGGEPWVW